MKLGDNLTKIEIETMRSVAAVKTKKTLGVYLD